MSRRSSKSSQKSSRKPNSGKSGAKKSSKRGSGGKKQRHQGGSSKKRNSAQGRGRSFKKDKKQRSDGPPYETFTGTIQKNPRGFAFILCDDREQPDTFVPQRLAEGIFSKDRVEFTRVAEGERWAARRIKVIQRNTDKIVGQIHKDHGKYFIEDKENRVALKHDKKLGAAEGSWAVAKIEEYSTQSTDGRAALQEIFGEELGPQNDLPLTCARFGLDLEFPEKVKSQATAFTMPPEEELEKRQDLRELPFVTIDGADAKDYDDAVLVEKLKNGYRLRVAIADVAHFVTKGSALDREAFRRGTSVYFPGICIPMLPEELSNDLCSLRPQEERLALTCEIQYDTEGEVKTSRCYESIIKTWHRLTYEQVEEYHTAGVADPALENIADPLAHLFELYQILVKKRAQRGTLEFNLPEAMVSVDEHGVPTAVTPRQRLDSHRLIEEFMIAANEAVAKLLKAQKLGALYRVHEAPGIESVDEINELMRELGIREQLKGRGSKTFANLLERTDHLPNAKTLHKFILRKQKQAVYRPDPIGHFGLALKDYCHFTSPIRRYPDLVVHRSLKRYLTRQKNALPTLTDLESAGVQCSNLERRAIDAERFMLKRKFCWFLATRLHNVYEANIASITEHGVYAEIQPSGIDVLVPPSQLLHSYEFDADTHCLRRRPGGQVLHVGDPLRVEIMESDPEELSIIGQETTRELTSEE